MKMLHFVDGAADQLFINSEKVSAFRVSDADTVLVRFQSLEDPTEATGDDVVTLTATGKAAEVALRLGNLMVGTNIGGPSVLTIKAATAPFAEVSTVAYTVGA
tara:strand:+ start:263 stop:571 length:309 start_codon:yes stop_codon:yes gene_type:complete